MTEDCNSDVLKQARRNVADKYVQGYHHRAILSGEWDEGQLVTDELQRLLKEPEITNAEEVAS
jgi:hypothetical protein